MTRESIYPRTKAISSFRGSRRRASFFDDVARRFSAGGGTGSALSSHAVYQRLLSIVAARAGEVIRLLRRFVAGIESPFF